MVIRTWRVLLVKTRRPSTSHWRSVRRCDCGLVWLRVGPLPAVCSTWPTTNRRRCSIGTASCCYESRAGDGTRAMWLDAARFRPTSCPRRLPQKTAASTAPRRRSAGDRARGVAEPCAKARSSKVDPRSASRWRSCCSRGRTPRRRRAGCRAKMREAIVALRLEHRLTKHEILALYLNLAPYGNQIDGAERASRAYFGSPASVLTPAQAAFLAGLPQRPSRFNPFRNPAAALARQRRVIDRMEALGLLTRRRPRRRKRNS